MVKSPEPTPADEPAFESTDLALAVIQAMIEAKLLETDLVIPDVEAANEDDLEDESESWRDTADAEQEEVIEALEALLDQHRDKLDRITALHGVLTDIAGDYRCDFYSLAGIEACTALERITIWSSEVTLDLSPLAKLPALVEVDVTFAHVDHLEPLLAIPTLKSVIGTVEGKVASALVKRGVTITPRKPAEA